MSASGTERTFAFVAIKSAFDPKLTFRRAGKDSGKSAIFTTGAARGFSNAQARLRRSEYRLPLQRTGFGGETST
jgi:hypothetical protein